MESALGGAVATLLRQQLRSNGFIEIPAEGVSMYPFIQPGNRCRFEARLPQGIRRGDVLLFETEGRLLGHRFLRMRDEGQTQVLVCKGDANLFPDSPIRWSQVIGVLVSIRSNQHDSPIHQFRYRAWTTMVFAVPAYSKMARWLAQQKAKRAAGAEAEAEAEA